jgi:hypothetical protein
VGKLNLIRISDSVIPNRVYIGEIIYSTEEHHFTIICADSTPYVVNTYGGKFDLFITHNDIEIFNKLLPNTGNSKIFKRIFGMIPNKDSKVHNIMLKEYPLLLPKSNDIFDILQMF